VKTIAVRLRLPSFVLLFVLAPSAMLLPLRGASAAATDQTLRLPVATTARLALGTATLHLSDDGPLAVATVDPATLSLPKGTYDVSACLASVPATASVAQPCATTTTTLDVAGKATAPTPSLTLYRPLDAANPVSVTAVINVRLRVGTVTTAFATSWGRQRRPRFGSTR